MFILLTKDILRKMHVPGAFGTIAGHNSEGFVMVY